jgi:putative oxidoreductase
MNIDKCFARFGDHFDLIGRLCIAFIFVRSPIRKILGYERFEGMLEEHGVATELLPLVILTELLCGLAIAVGWNTRLAAFLLAGFTAVATLIFHMDWDSHFSVYLMFSKNIAILGGLLFIVGRGAGRFSLDARASIHGNKL